MATTRVTIAARPEEVFAVLAEANCYERWLVGCKQIRDVEGVWPEPGSRFYHKVGIGPIEVNDHTEVVSMVQPTELVLEARARPVGVALVEFRLAPAGDGCEVTMHEKPIRGLAKAVDNPLLDASVKARNDKSLRNLRAFVELRKSGDGGPPGPSA